MPLASNARTSLRRAFLPSRWRHRGSLLGLAAASCMLCLSPTGSARHFSVLFCHARFATPESLASSFPAEQVGRSATLLKFLRRVAAIRHSSHVANMSARTLATITADLAHPTPFVRPWDGFVVYRKLFPARMRFVLLMFNPQPPSARIEASQQKVMRPSPVENAASRRPFEERRTVSRQQNRKGCLQR